MFAHWARRLMVAGFVMATVVVLAQPAWAQAERFSGTIANTGGGIGPAGLTQFTIRIDQYTSDEETLRLLHVLAEEGVRKLEDELIKAQRGRFQLQSELGHDIGVARSFQLDDGGRLVRIVAARALFLFETFEATRSRDYPFGVIELHLDKEGKGDGRVIAAARISFNNDNQLEVESFGLEPYRILSVEVQE